MLRNEDTSRKRKLGSEYSAELLELHDAEPEEIAQFGEGLDDLETIIGKIVRGCDLLIAQQA
jgi:hypothetical protein